MESKTEARRQAILEVAAEVFREVGFERVPCGKFAKRIGRGRQRRKAHTKRRADATPGA
jgi:AcrR family transcriptional regulator